MIHPISWLIWLIAAMVAVSASRNPLHLVLNLLCILIVYSVVDASDRKRAVWQTGGEQNLAAPISPWGFALVIVPLSGLFNALTVHFGDTVLFRLPAGVPVFGGAVTLEALVYGMLNGLVLSGLLMAFAVINLALPIRSLIRLVPQAFYSVGIVISIAVTFVPTTLRQFKQVREAQAVRGHKVRGVRDWLPLFIPLLIGGLERALQLAEAMTARGFASSEETSQQDGRMRLPVVIGLMAVLVGWVGRLVWGMDLIGSLLMLAGGAMVVAVLWLLGRKNGRTAYRPDRWRFQDWAVTLCAALVLTALMLPGLDRSALAYYPYPVLKAPGFEPVIGVSLLGLLGPALLFRRHIEQPVTRSRPEKESAVDEISNPATRPSASLTGKTMGHLADAWQAIDSMEEQSLGRLSSADLADLAHAREGVREAWRVVSKLDRRLQGGAGSRGDIKSQ